MKDSLRNGIRDQEDVKKSILEFAVEFVTRRDWHFGKTEIARQHEGVVTDNPT
jgi:hypothetical protein